MEKLVELKEAYKATRIHMENGSVYGLDFEDLESIEWLIEQAEKVERYEKALKDIDHLIDISLYSLTSKRIGELVNKALASK